MLVSGGRKFPAILSIEISMFLYSNRIADYSRNVFIFFSEDLRFIKPDVVARFNHSMLTYDCGLSYICPMYDK